MEKQIHCTAIVSILALTVMAQEDPTGAALAASLEQAPIANPNRVGISYRAAFNVGVKFKNLGGFTPAPLHTRIPGPIAPGPATGFQENRVYEDGYNLLDDNLNDYGGLQATRNWGYLNSSQVVNSGDDQFVAMHVTSSAATASTGELDDDPLHGFEINYSRALQDHGCWRWGVGTAFNFMRINVSDSRPLTGGVTRLTDLFLVPEGGFVPDAPHFGSNSEGPLLGSEPSRTEQTFVDGASITGSRSFEANLFGFKAGPYVEFPLTEKLSLNASAGLTLIFVSSDFSYSSETVAISPAVDPSGLLNQTHAAGSDSHSDLLLGGYLNASLAWSLNENWSVFGGVEFQVADDYTHRDSASGKAAEMDLGQTIIGFLGVSYTF